MLNCILVQSRFQSLPLIESFLKNSPAVFLEKKMTTLSEVEYYCKSKKPEMVFCDIELGEQEIESIKSLNPESLMVYVGCREVAEKKIPDEKAFGYLYKPYSQERVLTVVDKAHEYLGYVNRMHEKKYIFLKSEYKMVRVNLDDILFCEGMKDYTQLYLRDKSKPLVTLQNLKSLTEKLDERKFVRVHRSYIVSLEMIDTISRTEISIGLHEIPVGDSYRERLFQIIDGNS